MLTDVRNTPLVARAALVITAPSLTTLVQADSAKTAMLPSNTKPLYLVRDNRSAAARAECFAVRAHYVRLRSSFLVTVTNR